MGLPVSSSFSESQNITPFDVFMVLWGIICTLILSLNCVVLRRFVAWALLITSIRSNFGPFRCLILMPSPAIPLRVFSIRNVLILVRGRAVGSSSDISLLATRNRGHVFEVVLADW